MLVKEIMRQDILMFKLNDTVEQAGLLMESHSSYGAPVIDDFNRLQGIFTRPHLIKAFLNQYKLSTPLHELMQKSVITLQPNDNFNDAIKVFVDTNYSYYPVINGENELQGVVLASDILQLGTQEFYKIFGGQVLDYYDNAFIGIDSKGYIRTISQTAREILGERISLAVNKHIVETIPIMENLAQDILLDAKKAGELSRQLSIAQKRIEYYQSTIETLKQGKYTFDNIIGMSNQMKRIRNIASQAAKTKSTVLIRGESGTGKELIAHAIHNASPRCNQPFIRVNCAAIPEQLIESELFGYCEGAFTGAAKGGKPGRFELANGGTIFLDEIGDLPYTAQAKILRVLQEFEFERVGGTKTINVNVRVIAATNRDLANLASSGAFRKDLFYRLNVVEIETPPLRDRKEDIDYLTDYLIEKICERLNLYHVSITDEARLVLRNYDFPGNVRELENILERAINFSYEIGQIGAEHLFSLNNDINVVKPIEENNNVKDLKETVSFAEKTAIIRALKMSNGNKNEAARLLNIHRSLLYKKIDKYGIS